MQDLLEADDGDFLLLLQLSALLRQLVVHLAAAHDDPLEALLLGGVGRPAGPTHFNSGLPCQCTALCRLVHKTAAA